MTVLRIALGDLRHDTLGTHSTSLPVGIGYIATYLQFQMPHIDFEFRLYTKPSEILDDIDTWSPHVVALSNYLWNTSLSTRVCEYAKEVNQETLCILGGPEFPAGTGQANIASTADLCLEYLQERPAVDYYCYSDGETAVVSLMEAFEEFNFDTNKLKSSGIPISGTCSINPKSKELVVGLPQARIGKGVKGSGRDVIPSPYTTGMLDKFLNGQYIPSIETQRGCPFFCAFCDQGLDPNKIVSFSVERICEELDYIADKVVPIKGSRALAFHDSNFGMYQPDYEIAEHLATLMEKHDWPQIIQIATPKNRKERILKIDSLLKNRVNVGLSQQSMNRDTLKEIKRDNYSNEEYLKFVKELKSRGKSVGCELIIPLPGETEETYHDSVRILTENGLTIGTYTLMMLCGSELGRREAIEKHQMEAKFRMLPRQFGIYRGKKVFEADKVCVATNTLPYESYKRCRRFSLIISLFSSKIFDPLRRHVQELGLDYYDFLNLIHHDLEDESIPTVLHKTYREFSYESEAELFDSKEDLFSAFDLDEEYEKLLNGELGDNLLRKYSTKMIFNIELLVERSYACVLNHLGQNVSPEKLDTISAVKTWLLNWTFVSEFANANSNNVDTFKQVPFMYDVGQWYSNKEKPLTEFKTDVSYKFTSKYNEITSELGKLFGEDAEFQFGKIFHSRPITEFFCPYERL